MSACSGSAASDSGTDAPTSLETAASPSSTSAAAAEPEEATSPVEVLVESKEENFGSEPATFPEALVDELAALSEVSEARPVVVSSNQTANDFVALDSNGEQVVPNGPPVLSISWDGIEDDSLAIFEGVAPDGIDQVALDKEYADSIPAAVGEEVEFDTPGGRKEFTVTAHLDIVTSGAGFVVFDFASAQTLFDKEGRVDTIMLSAEPGTALEELTAAVEEVLPADAKVSNVNFPPN